MSDKDDNFENLNQSDDAAFSKMDEVEFVEDAIEMDAVDMEDFGNMNISELDAAIEATSDSVIDQDGIAFDAPDNAPPPTGQDIAPIVPTISGGAARGANIAKRAGSDVTGAEGGAGGGGNNNRLGDRLVSLGIISEDQLSVALQEKRISGRMIGEVMVDLGFVSEETIIAVYRLMVKM